MARAVILPLLLCCVWVAGASSACSKRRAPHILFMLADDLGYNDVSLHGGQQIPTPHIDSIAARGLELDRYYVNAVCSPTRASLMTGRSILHHGISQPYPWGNRAEGLNLSYTTLPQHLKEYGYHNYMVGKWHLGAKTEAYLPTSRGFDRSFGFYAGFSDYWTHNYTYGAVKNIRDLHVGGSDLNLTQERVVEDFDKLNGTYASFMFADKASAWIAEHASTRKCEPMFMYLAWNAPHSAAQVWQQAPDSYLAKFAALDTQGLGPCGQYDAACTLGQQRRSYAAVTSALDDSIGQVIEALRKSHMLDNTIVVFSSDNGGPVNSEGTMANNFPLRSGKGSFYEGGVRGTGLIMGPGIKGQGRISEGVFHVSDWAPTLLTAVKRAVTGDPDATHNFTLKANEVPFKAGDGEDHWDMMEGHGVGRQELVHSVFAVGNTETPNPHAIMRGWWKLIYDSDVALYTKTGWRPPPGLAWNYTDKFRVKCAEPPALFNCTVANPCLFNLKTDPCEHVNVAASHADIVTYLQARIEAYRRTTVIGWKTFSFSDPRGADPKTNLGSTMKPWLPVAEEPMYYPSNYTGPGY